MFVVFFLLRLAFAKTDLFSVFGVHDGLLLTQWHNGMVQVSSHLCSSLSLRLALP